MSTTWINDDNLSVKFGLDEAKLSNIAAYYTSGPKRIVEIILDWHNMPTVAQNNVLIDEAFKLDKGALIESVEVVKPTEVFDSTSDDQTINIGVIDTDRTSNYTKAGLIDAMTQTEVNAGGTNISGWVGSLVGTVLTKTVFLMWEVDAHAASAGFTTVRITWSQPPIEGNTLVWSKA